MPWLWIASLYALMSLITFAAYGIDKHRAVKGQWRTKERTLHLLELAGGWPGALVGQAVFRHKRRKWGYMLVFAGIVVLHVAAWLTGWRLGWWGN